MATYFARKTGNVNDPDIWATTPAGTAADVFGTFTASDVLVCNSFTVTLNVDTTVQEIRGDNTGGATGTGGFSIANGVTLTGDVIATSNGTTTFLTISASSTTVTINGDIVGAGGSYGIRITGTGLQLVINGDVTGDSGATTYAIGGSANANIITVNGDVTGGSSATAYAIYLSGDNVTVNVVGNVTGGSGGTAIGLLLNGAAPIVNITGNVTGGSASSAHGMSVSGSSVAIVTVTGNITGGSGSAAYGCNFTSTGAATLAVNGNVIGGTGDVGLYANATNGTATVNGIAIGGPTQTSAVGIQNVNTGCIVYVLGIEYGDLGMSPTAGPIRLTADTDNTATFYRYLTTKKTLIDIASAPSANPADVRAGTSYDNGAQTGTLAVPDPANVVAGVPTDDTVGTWAFDGDLITRLENCATVATTGQQLADALTAP